MSKTKTYLLLYVLLFFYSFGWVFSKLAASYGVKDTKFYLFFSCSIGLAFLYAIFWQQFLKVLPLTAIYPIKSVIILFNMFWGYLFFSDPIKVNMVIGVIIITLGVFLVVSKNE